MRYLELKSQLVRPFLKARFLKEDFQAQSWFSIFALLMNLFLKKYKKWTQKKSEILNSISLIESELTFPGETTEKLYSHFDRLLRKNQFLFGSEDWGHKILYI